MDSDYSSILDDLPSLNINDLSHCCPHSLAVQIEKMCFSWPFGCRFFECYSPHATGIISKNSNCSSLSLYLPKLRDNVVFARLCENISISQDSVTMNRLIYGNCCTLIEQMSRIKGEEKKNKELRLTLRAENVTQPSFSFTSFSCRCPLLGQAESGQLIAVSRPSLIRSSTYCFRH